MRDPARIPVVLDAISEAWKKKPDWRLAQLIYNCTYGLGIYYLEDDELVRLISGKKE